MAAYLLVIYLISPNGAVTQSTREFPSHQACQVIANNINQDIKRVGQYS